MIGTLITCLTCFRACVLTCWLECVLTVCMLSVLACLSIHVLGVLVSLRACVLRLLASLACLRFQVLGVLTLLSNQFFYFCFTYSKNFGLVHCMKSVRIQRFSGPYFPAFRLNTERYSVYLRIQSECEKIWTRKTPNAGSFHAMATKK